MEQVILENIVGYIKRTKEREKISETILEEL